MVRRTGALSATRILRVHAAAAARYQSVRRTGHDAVRRERSRTAGGSRNSTRCIRCGPGFESVANQVMGHLLRFLNDRNSTASRRRTEPAQSEGQPVLVGRTRGARGRARSSAPRAAAAAVDVENTERSRPQAMDAVRRERARSGARVLAELLLGAGRGNSAAPLARRDRRHAVGQFRRDRGRRGRTVPGGLSRVAVRQRASIPAVGVRAAAEVDATLSGARPIALPRRALPADVPAVQRAAGSRARGLSRRPHRAAAEPAHVCCSGACRSITRRADSTRSRFSFRCCGSSPATRASACACRSSAGCVITSERSGRRRRATMSSSTNTRERTAGSDSRATKTRCRSA